MAASPGLWGGRTAAQRRAERRERLVGAAQEIWIEQGWAAVTMRGVCARTSLNDRYFYEDFADREDLLAAVWDGVRDELIAQISAIVAEDPDRPPLDTLRKTITLVVERVSGDPGWADIIFVRHVGSAVLEQRRIDLLHQATAVLIAAAEPYLVKNIDRTGFRMDTLVGIGGFSELVNAWRSGLLDVSADELIEHSTRIGATLASRYLAAS
ncbi:Putative transcriptional regulator, TetR family [Mycobacteroides abscessus subsp. abscessus]|uniref:Transcriptional regulator, TetR family n=3 Tax=Mycobacteroides abscessus TaxID=36809 RepID=A0AB38CSH2_9MYCO|nr:TetR/AcrR family transcriptional regulator [Mycobacteroides abscessus]ETZ86702.1 bacterial regulatory s, tetR family protein [Mycobacteroides abscessus MAB_030201_1075]ETZ92837.1 bacterial regulatory s, tetR family protein [Mycobacteroides abscessus MAB_030201_1061]AMU72326.1 TetR family transcriptional regulator [Mycobacteroides abscessus]ANO01060.1 TetR family transcriptional regulator [Mycobacteroides abscessus]AWG63294.1 TetR/AcrR family transcriptional regulator [Mycobacteroides absces